MKIKRVRAVRFSPVGNTKTITDQIAHGIAQTLRVPVETDSFTLPKERLHVRSFAADELVVFGMPTYAGRVPNKALPFIGDLFRAEQTPAVAVTTFGNRSFDESLKELCQQLNENGFAPFAAVAIVCRHVMSRVLGANRPDEQELAALRAFIQTAANRIDAASDVAALRQAFPFSYADAVGPYYKPLEEDGTPAQFLKAKPVTDLSRCDRCGICADVCPFGSIDKDDITLTPGICVKCHACVNHCPKRAKYFDDPSLRSHIAMLEKNYAPVRAACAFY